MAINRILGTALTIVMSTLPVSELYAACTYTRTMGGEWRYCDNGTCWSNSFWTSDNRIVESSVTSGCREGTPQT